MTLFYPIVPALDIPLDHNAHRGVSPREVSPWRHATHPVGKSDDSNSQFASRISIVVFGSREAVRRTEGVPPFVFPFLQVVDIPIHLNDQPRRRARMNYEG